MAPEGWGSPREILTDPRIHHIALNESLDRAWVSFELQAMRFGTEWRRTDDGWVFVEVDEVGIQERPATLTSLAAGLFSGEAHGLARRDPLACEVVRLGRINRMEGTGKNNEASLPGRRRSGTCPLRLAPQAG